MVWVLKNREGLFLLGVLFFSTLPFFAQDQGPTKKNKLDFSGRLILNTNGIGTVPAFTLGEPSITGILSLEKNSFGFDQYIAFSTQGEPWYIESYFNYAFIEREKFSLGMSAMWGVGYTHPEVILEGNLQTIAKAERYTFAIPFATYRWSEKVNMSLYTYHGYGFPEGDIRWATFISYGMGITGISLSKSLYTSLFPQLLFINLDWQTDAFFFAGKFGVGHKKIPLFLSTQISQMFAGNLSPNPGLRWNIGLSYSFD